jgi:ferritin
MLTKVLVDRLNQQINLEFYSSNLYLQMSSWCEHAGLEGCAEFMHQHAQEEMGHMQRLFNYVNETGSMAVLGQIDAPPTEYESIADVFRKTYEHECLVTRRINELADAAMKETDYSTFNFLQWYVAEQHEEEKLFKSILDKIELIGSDPKNLFFIDQEVRSKMVEAQVAPPTAG